MPGIALHQHRPRDGSVGGKAVPEDSFGQGCGQGAVKPGTAGRQSRVLLAPSPMSGTLVPSRRLHSHIPARPHACPSPSPSLSCVGQPPRQAGAACPSLVREGCPIHHWLQRPLGRISSGIAKMVRNVFPSSSFCAVGMLAQPTCPGESGQELARCSHMYGEGGCWAGGEKWGADEFCMQEIREVSSAATP